MEKMWSLMAAFLIIGMGAYGGGIVTVPLMQHELVAARHLLASDEMPKIIAIAR